MPPTSPADAGPVVDAYCPPPADGPFLIAMCDRDAKHAIRRAQALPTYEAIAAAKDLAPSDRDWTVWTLCGTVGDLVTSWGPFEHGNPHLNAGRCHACGWLVAIANNAIAAELDALAPDAEVMSVHARLLPEPLIAVRVCEAIIAAANANDAEFDLEHPLTAQLLGRASTHAPMLCLPEACADGNCDHSLSDQPDHSMSMCPMPDAEIFCRACSLTTGRWAGEWEGMLVAEGTVAAPCSILTTFVEYYGINLPSAVQP